MLSVSEAAAIIVENAHVLPAEQVALHHAVGSVLYESIIAPTDVPPFHQSAMDGYAFRFADWHTPQTPLTIVGTAPAGTAQRPILPAGAAVRIFTGAPLPAGADTVVMQEKVQLIPAINQLLITDTQLKPAANVRPQGSQIAQYALALPKGLLLNAGAIGYLAMLGIDKALIIPPPRITLLVTGNELAQPGTPLPPGHVYECNSFALQAALATMRLPLHTQRAPDDLAQTISLISTCAIQSDLLLITGGVSVGDYDFVPQALKACGANLLFHKVKQKPGKPMLAATLGKTLIIGLPGNPASVYTCFHRYVLPAIQHMMGQPLPPTQANLYRLAENYPKKTGLTVLLKGKLLPNNEVLPLPNQLSYLMDSFAYADCLIELEENKADYVKGEPVQVWKIKNPDV
ncbi:MAG TPA: molybdopterin molybdotransferase MoeA [Chitinophagales bacterium]|nr:molybdopterin molybdotransferase MoeA [Chitinophagales bacterium]HRK25706.1 molybdopterin molybdotransferase MoeA [Chitinophagales bacterium]